jgi:hypothetical protein
MALDLLKWLALLSMVLDHLRYVGEPGWPVCAGASGVPVVLPGDGGESASRAPRRGQRPMALPGLVAAVQPISEVPYRLFIEDADTLNVLPTLALGLLVPRGWQRRPRLIEDWRCRPGAGAVFSTN